MGCQMSQATVPKTLALGGINQKNHLTVATLNYCGIMNSPFEFYCQELQPQLMQISKIFVSLIPQYYPSFVNDKFAWNQGKIDLNFRVGRYSPMFSLNVGIQNGKFLNKQQFQQKWQAVFDPWLAKQEKMILKPEEIQTMKTYDFIMYHTLLVYVFKIGSIKDVEGKDPERYKQKIRPFFELSFLNEDRKLKKMINSFSKLQADIFFFQEYSKIFHDYLVNRKEHYIAIDAGETSDTMIVVKQASFKQKKSMDFVFAKLTDKQKENLNWAERSSFMCVDNYILIGAHLSSKDPKLAQQITALKRGLIQLKKALPEYNIIVGGDFNIFIPNEQPLSKQFNMYPLSKDQLTTIKKRTMTQAQYKKGNISVKESKDKIITTLKIQQGNIYYVSGEVPKKDSYVPSDEHPFDHFVVVTKLERNDG